MRCIESEFSAHNIPYRSPTVESLTKQMIQVVLPLDMYD